MANVMYRIDKRLSRLPITWLQIRNWMFMRNQIENAFGTYYCIGRAFNPISLTEFGIFVFVGGNASMNTSLSLVITTQFIQIGSQWMRQKIKERIFGASSMWNRIAERTANTKWMPSKAMKICINAQQLLSANLRALFALFWSAGKWTKRRTEKKREREANTIGQIYLFDFNWKWIRICLIGE